MQQRRDSARQWVRSGAPITAKSCAKRYGVDRYTAYDDLRGRGYAGAVTVEVSRAALAAGATDVVLFADASNPTSNALYQRIGYVPITDFTVYEFTYDASETS